MGDIKKNTLMANNWLKMQEVDNEIDMDEITDGFHTFGELYEFRKQYNACLFNLWSKLGMFDVHKSWHHHDELGCFGNVGKWFIVVAVLPSGQISNHYPAKEWDLFQVPAEAKALFP